MMKWESKNTNGKKDPNRNKNDVYLFTKRSPAIETAMLDRLLQMLSLPSIPSKRIRSPAFLSISASSKRCQASLEWWNAFVNYLGAFCFIQRNYAVVKFGKCFN
ncbi:uncharacterized protein LOC127128804 [Lathyrus oleraceus]|uniref:uncharacterized protein LOC127128804 n=1 Tax=Pisum sativum TaxID=3888 RepID=UPI0021D343DC|nr:uncharacterized protein LOC127128804 [Pisum sativum]